MATETFLNLMSTATSHEKLEYSISITGGQKVVTLTIEDINLRYYQHIKKKLSPILNKIISNLIRNRDFLGHQLNFEFGNISEEEYEQLELDFLTEPEEIPLHELKNDIKILMNLSNRVFNAEEISTMFNCPMETAEGAIDMLLLEEAE